MTTSAVIYARQSLDRHGDNLAVTRQLDLCRNMAAERGWEVVDEIVDNDLSATSGIARPGFERLLRTKPQHIIVWHIDRLLRLTRDLERVIDTGTLVHAVKAGHVDLSNPAGRAVARTITAWSTYEGEQKAERQKAANDQRAARGLPPGGGRRLYGYTQDGMTVIEEEERHVRTAVDLVLSGVPLRTVVRRITEDGSLTTAGNPWHRTHLRRYLTNPRLAALRAHRGQIVGDGTWPPIVSREEHTQLVATLNDPARRPKGRPGAYLLSGIARCGICGARIYGRVERRGPIYVCEASAHLGRKIADIDDFVETTILARLSLPDAASAFIDPDRADRAAKLHADKRALTQRLNGLAEAYATGAITLSQLTSGTTLLRAQVETIDKELPTLAATPAVESLVGTDDVIAAWDALDVESQRAVVGTLAEITIHPAGRGARYFREETVTITPRTTT